MTDWQILSETLVRTVRGIVGLVKRHRREPASIALAALLFWIGFSLPPWLRLQLRDWPGIEIGLRIVQAICYLAGLILLGHGSYRIWRLASPPALPPVE